MTPEAAIKLLFEGLKPVQKKMFLAFFAQSKRKAVFHCSRRLGKTHLLCVIATCVAISKPNAQIRYATFTQKALKKMVLPIFKQLFLSLPRKYKPTFNIQEGSYNFKNGSQIHLSGVNNNQADNLRGVSSDLGLVDEAGFCDDLSYLIESVLMPQLLTANGKLIMASSSPLSPAHEFADYINQSKIDGSYSSYDIHKAGYKPELIAEFCAEAGGEHSTTWRREYLNEVIVDEVLAIIPEWNSQTYVQETKPDAFYSYYHRYCAADWGVRDKTAILWAYYDFKRAKLIIEDEFSCSGSDSTTRNIAENVKLKEAALGYKEIYRRPADNNQLILLQDLASEFNLHFYPTNKDTLAAMINEARLWVQQGRVIVHPRCKELIACLEFGVFASDKRSEFGRSKSLGHYDMLAAFTYLIRNIDQATNPIPASYGKAENVFSPENWEESPTTQTIKQIFNIK